MECPVQLYMRKAHFIALSFGFSNLSNFVTWEILYYTAARLISDRVIPLDEVSNTLLSIIVILFGAQSSTAAQSHAPDLGKAKVAADKIYWIINANGRLKHVEMRLSRCLRSGKCSRGRSNSRISGSDTLLGRQNGCFVAST
jgi:hypothetical protein